MNQNKDIAEIVSKAISIFFYYSKVYFLNEHHMLIHDEANSKLLALFKTEESIHFSLHMKHGSKNCNYQFYYTNTTKKKNITK